MQLHPSDFSIFAPRPFWGAAPPGEAPRGAFEGLLCNERREGRGQGEIREGEWWETRKSGVGRDLYV